MTLRFLHCCRPLLLAVLLAPSAPAFAQLAYSGLPGAEVFKKAQQLEAAGNKAAAAATYQQAYEAYTSVDDSDGMSRALARKKALGGAAAPAAAPGPVPTAARPAAGRAAATARAPAAGPTPVAGHLVAGKPVGLFFVTKSVLGRFSTMTYYFSPEGMAYENPPGLSPTELAATPARSKGRYSVAGKTLSIAWNGYPKPESAEMHPLSGGFSWADALNIFSGVGPFKSAAQLVGTFEGSMSTIATVMGQSVVSKSLTFKADGTYTGSGVATVTTATERSVAETGGSSKQGGRWSLNGWLLTLTDAQGHSTRDIAYPVGTDAKVTLFNFSGIAYARQ